MMPLGKCVMRTAESVRPFFCQDFVEGGLGFVELLEMDLSLCKSQQAGRLEFAKFANPAPVHNRFRPAILFLTQFGHRLMTLGFHRCGLYY